MLTATYTLVALSVEQASVRVSLHALHRVLQTSLVHKGALTPAEASATCEAVKRIYESGHWCKLERYLIPAIRKATPDADQLLQDLDELGRVAADAVETLLIRLGGVAPDSHSAVQFCAALDAFCSVMLERLEREEKHLFPIARAGISGEAWFSIANAMLAHEAHVQDCRPVRSALPTALAAQEADDYFAEDAICAQYGMQFVPG